MILFDPMPSGVSGGLSHYGFEGIRMNIPGDSRTSLFRGWAVEPGDQTGGLIFCGSLFICRGYRATKLESKDA